MNDNTNENESKENSHEGGVEKRFKVDLMDFYNLNYLIIQVWQKCKNLIMQKISSSH